MLTHELPRSVAADRTAHAARIAGYDLARALAIFGMIVVHFSQVMAADPGGGALGRIVRLFEGRAVAVFVVLAGVGATLLTRRASDAAARAQARRRLARRGLFFLALGLLNLLMWPGDILRVYGVTFMLAAWCFALPGRGLLALAAGFCLGFAALMLRFDYSQNWDWATLTYHGLWTPSGLVRNLFFDGFRSVFPWSGLFFLGMWLGRLDLRAPRMRRLALLGGLGAAAGAAAVSLLLRGWLARATALGPADINALAGTDSIPPLPLFLISAAGWAVAAVAGCVWLADRFAGRRLTRALIATGQMALTWYAAHIVLGLGGLEAAGAIRNQPLWAALLASALFFAGAVACSALWRRRFARGPLEEMLRRLTE